jgi:hypothetical protein
MCIYLVDEQRTHGFHSSSVVYGCFLGVGAFIFGLARAYAPKLLFLAIFGTIALDIICVSHGLRRNSFLFTLHHQTIGPLFPTSDYTLLQSMVISSASYIAIACLVTLIVFPRTTNHICMGMISDHLLRIQDMITMQEVVLASSPEDLINGTPLSDRVRAQKMGMVAAQRLRA